MGIERSKRVVWRLREMKTIKPKTYSYKQVRKAIMYELGTCERTIIDNIKILTELGLLKRYRRWQFIDTGKID